MAYATPTEVETLLGDFEIPSDWQDGSNTKLLTALARAKEIVDSFCGNTFEPVRRVVLLNGTGCAEITTKALTRYPIAAVVSVKIRTSLATVFDTVAALAEGTDFYVHASRRGLVRLSEPGVTRGYRVEASADMGDAWESQTLPNVWPRGQQNIQLIADFGRDGVPAVIKKAVVLLVREEIEPGTIGAYADELVSESFADGYSKSKTARNATSASNAPAITTGNKYIDVLLNPYRNNVPAMG